MAISYEELISAPTKADHLATLLGLAALSGFPVTAWQAGDVPRTELEILAETAEVVTTLVKQIAQGGLVDEAVGDFLTILGRSVYDEERSAAVKTQGQVTLTCASGAGPYTVNVGTHWVQNAAGLRFVNITGGTLPDGGTLDLTYEAEEAAAAYNLANGTITIQATPLAGVTVNNPDPGSGSWITQNGADEEQDEPYRVRLKAKWASINFGGATADTYHFWATTASDEVRRTLVLEHNNGLSAADGHVTVYLAGDSGPVSSAAKTAVELYIAPRRTLCTTPHIFIASENSVNVTATITMDSAEEANVLAAIDGLLNAYIRTVPIGGTVYRSALIEVLMNPDGVHNVVLTAPASDVSLAANEVATINTTTITPDPI